MKDSHSIAKGLVSVLLDETARIDERDDAAMDLDDYDYDYVIDALVKVGQDPNLDELVVNKCGESLGIIWTRTNQFNLDQYDSLQRRAKFGVYCVIESRKPEWLKEYNLTWPPQKK